MNINTVEKSKPPIYRSLGTVQDDRSALDALATLAAYARCCCLLTVEQAIAPEIRLIGIKWLITHNSVPSHSSVSEIELHYSARRS